MHVSTYRREAQDHMKILSSSRDKITVEVVIGWWDARHLFLHHTDEALGNFVQLITGEQIGHLPNHTKKKSFQLSSTAKDKEHKTQQIIWEVSFSCCLNKVQVRLPQKKNVQLAE